MDKPPDSVGADIKRFDELLLELVRALARADARRDHEAEMAARRRSESIPNAAEDTAPSSKPKRRTRPPRHTP